MSIFDLSLLDLPTFDDCHRKLAMNIENWVEDIGNIHYKSNNIDEVSRQILQHLASEGWLEYAINNKTNTELNGPDFRSFTIIREALAYLDDLYDFMFSIHSLGAAPMIYYGSDEQKRKYLPEIIKGNMLCAFAVTEPGTGSDISAITLQADRDGDSYVIHGTKAWISNASIANYYCVLAKTGGNSVALGSSFFLIPSDLPNITVNPQKLLAARSIGTIEFDNCVVPTENMIGRQGYGFRYAMEILSKYRMTVGSAAIGFSRKALHSTLLWSKKRRIQEGTLFDTQLTKVKFADIAVFLEAASLMVARSAWELDYEKKKVFNVHSSMAKLFATEGAQRVIDDMLQLCGASGLISGSVTEKLYRQIRSLRIYEGTSEIQKLIIAGSIK
jgi:acyl-CoA dehydrogenase